MQSHSGLNLLSRYWGGTLEFYYGGEIIFHHIVDSKFLLLMNEIKKFRMKKRNKGHQISREGKPPSPDRRAMSRTYAMLAFS